MKKQGFETRVLHTSYEREDVYGALAMPVYNTAAYEFETAEAMEAAFCGRTADHAYSRITNPTVQHFENCIRSVTGALGVTALNSGMAAISNALITVAYAGSNVVTSSHLFGNTYSFLKNTLAAFGVECRCCDLTNMDEVRAQVDEHTCALFLEVITNPQLEVADLKKLAAIAHEKGVPLIADTTVVPFHVFQAAVKLKANSFIRAGYSATADIVLEKRENVLGIKEKLITFAHDTASVEIEVKPKVYEKKIIKTGLSDGITIEVLEGLTKDDKIKVPAN